MKSSYHWLFKILAINFIILILLTNIWLYHFLFNYPLPHWIQVIIEICTFGVIISGSLNFLFYLKKKVFPPHDKED